MAIFKQARLRMILPAITYLVSPAVWADSSAEQILLQGAGVSQRCEMQFLKHLGWSFAAAPVSAPTLSTVNSCASPTLAQAQAAGALRLTIPSDLRGPERTQAWALLKQMGAYSGSMCAYKFRVRDGITRALGKLAQNKRFDYLKVDGDGPICSVPDNTWITNGPKGYGYWGKAEGASQCVESLYFDPVAGDCAVGLQMATFASHYELYDDVDLFNRAFHPWDLALGSWEGRKDPFFPNWNPQDKSSQHVRANGDELLKQGPAAYYGIAGYMGNKNEVVNASTRGENFLTLSVSAAAAASLDQHHGFDYYSRANEQIVAAGLGYATTQWIYEHQQVPSSLRGARAVQGAKVLALLRDPVYREYKVWVHPLGARTLGEYVIMLLKIHPKVPYEMTFYNSPLNTDLFKRYRDTWISACVERG